MEIVRAKPADAAALTEIAFAAKNHWGYPKEWMESWREELSVSAEFITDSETYAAVAGGRIIGFYALGRAAGRLDMRHLWVAPEAMRRGIGRSLFQHAIQRAGVLGFRELEIESDPNAEGFYQRMGARRTGTNVRKGQQRRRELPTLVYEIVD